MRNFKLTLEYDGTAFEGWQIQPRHHRSIQGEIEKNLHKIFKRKTRLIGSGRTDSGVHADGQVANFKANTRLTTEKIHRALNAHLPEDISVLNVEKVPNDFHAQYSAKSKTYRYTIFNRPARSSRWRAISWHIPYPLNVAAMHRAAKSLVGRKDFRSFVVADPKRRRSNAVRTIKGIYIKKSRNILTIDIEADGFLYKMVRSIIGTLVLAGRGELNAARIKRILRTKDRTTAGYTAPAHGLCLLGVNY